MKYILYDSNVFIGRRLINLSKKREASFIKATLQ
jgi:hypothetical protein